MEKNLTKCEVVALKTVFPETRRIGYMPDVSSEACSAILKIRGNKASLEDMQPWVNAPVLAIYDTADTIIFIVYRATCLANDETRFGQSELCLLPVKAYYDCDLNEMERCRRTFPDTEDGVTQLLDFLAGEGIVHVDTVTFMEDLRGLKTEKIFNNRWSTLCCQDIELLKTGWHNGSYFNMFIETLIAAKTHDNPNNWYNSTVAITDEETGEREWFYLIHSMDVRCALAVVPATLQELMHFGITYGLCLDSPEGNIYFTNSDGEHYFAISAKYMDSYRRCLKKNLEYLKYVFTVGSLNETELWGDTVAAE